MTILNEKHKKWFEYNQLQKCGSLTISQDLLLMGLNCFFCSTICTKLEEFLKHITKQHLANISELYELVEKVDDVNIKPYETEQISTFEDLFEQTVKTSVKVEINTDDLDEEAIVDPFADNSFLNDDVFLQTKKSEEQDEKAADEVNASTSAQAAFNITINNIPYIVDYVEPDMPDVKPNIKLDIDDVTQKKAHKRKIDNESASDFDGEDSDYDAAGRNDYYSQSEDEKEDNDDFNNADIKTKIDVLDPSNKNIILKIIEYYKENTLLWDRQSKEWHRYNRKVLVLKQLVTQMQLCFQLTFSTKELRQIFCKLRQMYYKVIASADTKSLWCFDDLQFLPAEKEVNKTKKRSAKKCMNELMKVISKILINYPALWDVHNDSFRNRHQKEAVMLELGKQIEVEHTKEELRLAISRLKNFYYNEKSKRMSAEAEQKPFRSSNEEMFTDLKFLEEHVGPYYCTYENCKEGPFKLYDKLKSHLAAHEGRKAFTCKYCDADFSSHGNLEIHIQRRHSNETPYSCPTCSRPFRTMADLRSHSHIHREAKNFVCCLCGKTYHTNAHLNRHYRRHDTDNYQFKCPHCPKKYCEKYRLRDHLNSHMQHREHVCEECGKGFFSQHTLHQHQKLHSDEMNYECNLCGKRFKQVSAMHSHKKYYHNTLSAAELATKTSS